jgi:hypothetical protein
VPVARSSTAPADPEIGARTSSRSIAVTVAVSTLAPERKTSSVSEISPAASRRSRLSLPSLPNSLPESSLPLPASRRALAAALRPVSRCELGRPRKTFPCAALRASCARRKVSIRSVISSLRSLRAARLASFSLRSSSSAAILRRSFLRFRKPVRYSLGGFWGARRELGTHQSGCVCVYVCV